MKNVLKLDHEHLHIFRAEKYTKGIVRNVFVNSNGSCDFSFCITDNKAVILVVDLMFTAKNGIQPHHIMSCTSNTLDSCSLKFRTKDIAFAEFHLPLVVWCCNTS